MKQIHLREKEQFHRLFRQQRIDRIEERFQILDVFLQNEQHVTFESFSELLEKNGLRLDPSFVRETLDLLCHFGFARPVQFGNGLVRYEHRHPGQHHDHMICTRCGKIIEFEDPTIEALQVKLAAGAGFHMLQHKMEIYGICSECLKERPLPVTLDLSRPGERLVIVDFTGGAQARMRLLSLGLKIGDLIEVITNQGSGQVVISVDFHRYAMGRGLAQKIRVRPAE